MQYIRQHDTVRKGWPHMLGRVASKIGGRGLRRVAIGQAKTARNTVRSAKQGLKSSIARVKTGFPRKIKRFGLAAQKPFRSQQRNRAMGRRSKKFTSGYKFGRKAAKVAGYGAAGGAAYYMGRSAKRRVFGSSDDNLYRSQRSGDVKKFEYKDLGRYNSARETGLVARGQVIEPRGLGGLKHRYRRWKLARDMRRHPTHYGRKMRMTINDAKLRIHYGKQMKSAVRSVGLGLAGLGIAGTIAGVNVIRDKRKREQKRSLARKFSVNTSLRKVRRVGRRNAYRSQDAQDRYLDRVDRRIMVERRAEENLKALGMNPNSNRYEEIKRVMMGRMMQRQIGSAHKLLGNGDVKKKMLYYPRELFGQKALKYRKFIASPHNLSIKMKWKRWKKLGKTKKLQHLSVRAERALENREKATGGYTSSDKRWRILGRRANAIKSEGLLSTKRKTKGAMEGNYGFGVPDLPSREERFQARFRTHKLLGDNNMNKGVMSGAKRVLRRVRSATRNRRVGQRIYDSRGTMRFPGSGQNRRNRNFGRVYSQIKENRRFYGGAALAAGGIGGVSHLARKANARYDKMTPRQRYLDLKEAAGGYDFPDLRRMSRYNPRRRKLDGTGPEGRGPRTGRGLGYCPPVGKVQKRRIRVEQGWNSGLAPFEDHEGTTKRAFQALMGHYGKHKGVYRATGVGAGALALGRATKPTRYKEVRTFTPYFVQRKDKTPLKFKALKSSKPYDLLKGKLQTTRQEKIEAAKAILADLKKQEIHGEVRQVRDFGKIIDAIGKSNSKKVIIH